ncbi:hypothetical protein POM88_024575 [Heracleum sosnowskyi]|uniref:Ubiquitin-like protease family profile domain-containing protein n=1 Tax=Heracleum sosnowskyi TaxID=360622 RepID=A0AAD8I3B2_9APIA|nr:hypothetical protein POM88_024575 [Heracleum sosnowskyi]
MKEELARDGETKPVAENSNLENNVPISNNDEMKEEPAQDGETELENLVRDENDKVNNNIANITHNVEENISTFDEDIDIKENVFLETLESNINHIEKITQICRADLVIARALFSENNKVNELEMRFAKLHESSINTPWSRKKQNYNTPSQRIFDHDGRNMQNEFDSVAVGSVKMDAEQRAEYTVEDNKIEERPHRDLKMANVLKSPFYDRTADINGKTLTVDEARTWRWLNRNQDNPNQTVFEWNQIKCFKDELQSLRLNEQILASVIDTWACICNVLEDMRAPESPRRLFCTIETTVGTLSRRNQKSTNLMYTNFARNLDHICEKYGVKLNDVDMIFFPIHDINHYYLICYNLKNPSVEIIDNSAYCGSATNIYDGFPESLHKHFIKYLRQNLFRRIIQMRLVQFVRLEMPWRTTSNQVDCGIFVMRHMEKYKADGSRGWSDFYHEGPNQSRQLARLRTLYCHKIIGSPLNIWKDLPIYELE